jgi:hypothetical protein
MFSSLLLQLWQDDQGQDIAEYAVMMVILVISVSSARTRILRSPLLPV